jgi:heme-degrading monooxygenase HmoA
VATQRIAPKKRRADGQAQALDAPRPRILGTFEVRAHAAMKVVSKQAVAAFVGRGRQSSGPGNRGVLWSATVSASIDWLASGDRAGAAGCSWRKGVASQGEARRSCPSIQGAPMIGVTVTFTYAGDFDRSRVTKVAQNARGMFEGMPGLRFKFFTFDEKQQRTVNFYVWDSEEAAERFFSEELRERVTGLYGVAPVIEFVEIAEIVDNSAS